MDNENNLNNQPDENEAQLLAGIADDDAQLERLEMELLDPFSDVTTPEGSDDDGVDVGEEATSDNNTPPTPIDTAMFMERKTAGKSTRAGFLRRMSLARWDVGIRDSYKKLYENPKYRAICHNKVEQMKKIAPRASRLDFVTDPDFLNEMSRIFSTYPDAESRGDLILLIAMYCYLDNLARKPEDSSDESDDEVVANVPAKIKYRRDKPDSDDEEHGGKKAKLGQGQNGQGVEVF